MKYVFETLRVLFVSLEFLATLICIGMLLLYPDLMTKIGELMQKNDDFMKYAPVAAVALAGYSIKLAWSLTTPKEGSNRELYDWPDYWKLKLRRTITITISSVCALSALALWLMFKEISPSYLAVTLLWSLSVSVISCGCALFATFAIKEIMEE